MTLVATVGQEQEEAIDRVPIPAKGVDTMNGNAIERVAATEGGCGSS